MSEKLLTADQLVDLIDKAIKDYSGPVSPLLTSIGFLMVGRKFGWKVMFLMHSQTTVRKYENILNIKSRDVMPVEGPLARKAVCWDLLQKITNFWRAVNGEVPGAKTQEVRILQEGGVIQ